MRYALAVLTLALASCGANTDNRTLTMDALGRVKIGMTVEQAEKTLGAQLAARQEDFFEPGCWYTSPAGKAHSHIHYMVAGVVIVRIDVGKAAKGEPPVHDPKGFGIGSDEKAIITAYGPKLENTPHPYLPDTGRNLRISDAGGKNALVFETDEGKVTAFRSGRIPFVDYVEGCS